MEDTRQYQFEVSRTERLYAYSTVSEEEFDELRRDCEAIEYCSFCEDAFAIGLDTEGKCYKCHGYTYAPASNHAGGGA